MKTSLISRLESLNESLLGQPAATDVTPEQLHQLTLGGIDPFELVRVAVIVKYGPNVRESAFKFVEEVSAIYARHVANNGEPALGDKLAALKESVGEGVFEKLLSNPEIERLAQRAYNRALDAKHSQVMADISSLFNGAIDTEILASVIFELDNSADAVAELSRV